MWCGVLCTWYGKRNVSLFSFKIKMEIHSVDKWYANRTTKQYFFRKTARILFQAVLIYQSGTCHKLSYLWLCLSTSLNRSFASVNSLFTWYYLGFNSWNVCRYWVHPTLFGKFHYDSSVLNILWHWKKVNVCFFSQSISNSNRYVNWTEECAKCEIPFACLSGYFVTTNKPKYKRYTKWPFAVGLFFYRPMNFHTIPWPNYYGHCCSQCAIKSGYDVD